VAVFQPWTIVNEINKDDRWTVAELADEGAKLLQ
jgi:hypothetical protein